MKQLKLGLAALCAVLILCGMAGAHLNAREVSDLKRAAKTAEQQAREKQDELAEINTSVDTKEVEVAMHNVSQAGNKICDIQNRVTASRDPDEILRETDALKTYFDNSVLRTRWFASNERNVTWKFETPYDAAMREIPVLWTLRANKDGEILAVVRGIYHVSTETFGNMELHITRFAARFTQTDGREADAHGQ